MKIEPPALNELLRDPGVVRELKAAGGTDVAYRVTAKGQLGNVDIEVKDGVDSLNFRQNSPDQTLILRLHYPQKLENKMGGCNSVQEDFMMLQAHHLAGRLRRQANSKGYQFRLAYSAGVELSLPKVTDFPIAFEKIQRELPALQKACNNFATCLLDALKDYPPTR
jgi:hypothetical protein